MGNRIINGIKAGLAGLLISASVACDSEPSENQTLPKKGPATQASVNNDLEAKLNKLKVFDAGDLKVPEGLDITAEALGEGKGVLNKLKGVVNEAYGEHPVLMKFSSTWCLPCRKSYQSFVRFANENPSIKAVHIVADEKIIGKEAFNGLSLAYGVKRLFPSYVVISKSGEILTGRYPTKGIKQSLELLENLPRGSDDYAKTVRLFQDFADNHAVNIDADQVTTVDGSTVLRNNYDLLNFVSDKTGRKITWGPEFEDLARKSHTYVNLGDTDTNSLLAHLAKEWKKKGNLEPLSELLGSPQSNPASDNDSFSMRQAIRVSMEGREDPHLLYNAGDFFKLVGQETGLEVRASEDVRNENIYFSTSGGRLLFCLNMLYIENRKYSSRMFDIGNNPLLVIQKKK